MDIRIRGTRAEVDEVLPGLLRGGLQVRSLYDRDGVVAVYLELSGTSVPSAQFRQQARVQSSPPPTPTQQALSTPQAALPAPQSSLREHFARMGLDLPAGR